ncbi:MAG: hypothetical protein ACTS8S_16705 [Giesbergeria sp.]
MNDTRNMHPVAATAEQQQVLDRIAAQRLRLRERKERRAEALSAVRDAKQVAGLGPDAPLATRLAVFARLHPVAVAVAGVAALALGPRRLMRWAGVAMPMLMRLRGR